MTILTAQSQIQDASTADLLETYNALTGKQIKKFSSRAAAETQVSNAILAALDRAGHAGVAKGEQPTIKLNTEGTAIVTNETTTEQVEAEKPAKAKRQSKAKPAPAKKAAAKASKAKPATAKKAAKVEAEPKRARSTYSFFRLVTPETPRRPQADSMRSQVLSAIRAADAKLKEAGKRQRIISADEIAEQVGFNPRSFLGKLQEQGWVEVAAAPGA